MIQRNFKVVNSQNDKQFNKTLLLQPVSQFAPTVPTSTRNQNPQSNYQGYSPS